MTDPCHQEDAEIDKALGEDWPRKRRAELAEALEANHRANAIIAQQADEMKRLTDEAGSARKTLLDYIKVTGGVYDKTFKEVWKGEELTQGAEYHAGAWQAIHAMQDFVERLP